MLNKNLNNQKSSCYTFKLLNEKERIGTGKKITQKELLENIKKEKSKLIYFNIEKEYKEISKIFNDKSNINNCNQSLNPFHLTTNQKGVIKNEYSI